MSNTETFCASFSRVRPSALVMSAVITAAWARASLPHQDTAAIYLQITPDADTTLVSASSPDADMAMLHTTTHAGDMSSMADMAALPLHAHQTTTFAPGGMHIMLTGLKHPLTAGGSVDVSLRFSNGQTATVHAPVQPVTALGPPPAAR